MDFFDDVFSINIEIKELLLNGNCFWKICVMWFDKLINFWSFLVWGNVIKLIEF